MKCCNITPGMMNRRIIIERLAITADTLGGFTEVWQQIANPWCYIKPMSGRELLHADKIDAAAVSRFVIRYRSDLIESDRILFKSQYYNIRSIININEANKYLELTAERGVAQ